MGVGYAYERFLRGERVRRFDKAKVQQYPNSWLGIRGIEYEKNSHKMISAEVDRADV